jgi:hypothetical protein
MNFVPRKEMLPSNHREKQCATTNSFVNYRIWLFVVIKNPTELAELLEWVVGISRVDFCLHMAQFEELR